MSFRTTILLAILAAGVTGAVQWLESHKIEGWLNQVKIDDRVDSIHEIDIVRGGERVELRKVDGTWQLQQPIRFLAHQQKSEDLATQLRQFIPTFEGDLDPNRKAEYGLDQPVAQVTMRTKRILGAGNEYRWVFGKSHPMQGHTYVQFQEKLYLCRSGFRDAFAKVDVKELRSRAVSTISKYEAASVRIESANEADIEWERREHGWRMIQPYDTEVRRAAIDEFIDGLHAWEVLEFVDDGPKPDYRTYGLEKPRFTVQIAEPEGGRSVTISVGDSDGASGVYVARKGEPYVFLVEGDETLALIEQGPDAYRDRRLMFLEAPDMATVEIKTRHGTTRVVRDQGGWTLHARGQTHQVEQVWLEAALDGLAVDTAVQSFLPRDDQNWQDYGFDDPAARIRVESATGVTEELLIGRTVDDEPGTYFVLNLRWSYIATAFLLGAKDLIDAPFPLRSRSVLRLREDQLRRIELTLDDGISEVFVRPKSTWRRKGASSQVIAQNEIGHLASTLLDFKAESWQAPPADGLPSLENFDLQLRVRPLRDGDPFPPRTFSVGPRDPKTGMRIIRDGLGEESWFFRVRYDSRRDPFLILRDFVNKLER